MAVTPDELELPLFVTDSRKELAEKYNIDPENLSAQITHANNGKRRGAKFLRIVFDDDEVM
jgi:hypothetical protein